MHVLFHIEIICLGLKELTLHEGMYDTMTVFESGIVGPWSRIYSTAVRGCHFTTVE